MCISQLAGEQSELSQTSLTSEPSEISVSANPNDDDGLSTDHGPNTSTDDIMNNSIDSLLDTTAESFGPQTPPMNPKSPGM